VEDPTRAAALEGLVEGDVAVVELVLVEVRLVVGVVADVVGVVPLLVVDEPIEDGGTVGVVVSVPEVEVPDGVEALVSVEVEEVEEEEPGGPDELPDGVAVGLMDDEPPVPVMPVRLNEPEKLV